MVFWRVESSLAVAAFPRNAKLRGIGSAVRFAFCFGYSSASLSVIGEEK